MDSGPVIGSRPALIITTMGFTGCVTLFFANYVFLNELSDQYGISTPSLSDHAWIPLKYTRVNSSVNAYSNMLCGP